MIPSFLERLAAPRVQNVLVCGCGGGFDFLHGLLLYPELERLGKRVVIASHSFGDVHALEGDATVVFAEGDAVVKRVTARTRAPATYAPEVHLCSFLDARRPERAPHAVYASNARMFSVASLTRFYGRLVREHALDAVVLVDGGSDALMVGDEHGLGDPVEDAVSVQAVAALQEVPVRVLLSSGLGVDRHNGVSDASALRAVAEIGARGGFLGALAVEPGSSGHRFYRDLVEHVYVRQTFRSTVTAAVLAAIEGRFGTASTPEVGGRPAGPDSLFVWPLMAILWAFDVDVVAERSLLGRWLAGAPDPAGCHTAVRAGRRALGQAVREAQPLPGPDDWPWAALYDAP